MLVKITQPGWEGFNGDLGTVQFEDAKSTGHIPQREAYALGAYISVVEIDEDGEHLGPVSPGNDSIKAGTMSAEVVAPMRTLAVIRAEASEAAAKAAEEAGEAPAEDTGPKVWTVSTLSEIADKDGISGIREIADPLGVKGTSIKGLISEIMLRNPKV